MVWLRGPMDPPKVSTPRFGMRCVHRFGFRRPSLSKVDGEPHHRRDGEELALPVLKRLEPETRRRDVVDQCRLRLMVHDFLGGKGREAAERMADARQQKQ